MTKDEQLKLLRKKVAVLLQTQRQLQQRCGSQACELNRLRASQRRRATQLASLAEKAA